jgi:hypothetical protein
MKGNLGPRGHRAARRSGLLLAPRGEALQRLVVGLRTEGTLSYAMEGEPTRDCGGWIRFWRVQPEHGMPGQVIQEKGVRNNVDARACTPRSSRQKMRYESTANGPHPLTCIRTVPLGRPDLKNGGIRLVTFQGSARCTCLICARLDLLVEADCEEGHLEEASAI